MTEHTPDRVQREADLLVAAVHRYAEVCGLNIDGMLNIDVVVIVGQRGFNEMGGNSRVVSLVPTETPQYVVLGLLADITVEHHERVRRAVPDCEEDQ